MTGKGCCPAGERHTAVVLHKLSCHPTRLYHQKRKGRHVELEETRMTLCPTNEDTEAQF